MGPLLQVMPWAGYQNMTDRELEAIYAYLQAIPCVEGGGLNALPNRCVPSKTAAVASPKGITVNTRQYQLNGSQSTSVDGKPLTYAWSIPQGQGFPSAGISQGNTATPVVQFGGSGLYTFLLTVTDSKGTSATDTIAVNFTGF